MKSEEEFVKVLKVCDCSLSNVKNSLKNNLQIIKEAVKEFDIQKETKKSIEDFSDRERELLLSVNDNLEAIYNLIEEYNNL